MSESLVLDKQVLIIPVNDHFLIFHPLKGSLLVANELSYSLIKQFRSPLDVKNLFDLDAASGLNPTKQLVSMLYTAGMLSQPGEHFPEIKDAPQTFDVFIAWLHITNRCNLNCQYCYVTKSSERMDELTAKEAIQSIFTYASAQRYQKIKLKYAGGEPTLCPDFLMRLHRFAERLAEVYQIQLEGNILSNGVDIPEQLIQFSLKHNIKWAISLDGLHDTQRTLANGKPSCTYAIQALSRLQQADIQPHVAITVTRQNLAQLPLLVEYLLEHKLRFNLNFYRQHPTSSLEQQQLLRPDKNRLIEAMQNVYAVIEQNLPDYSVLSLLLDRMNLNAPHLHPCAAGVNYLSVGHQGQVAPCQMLLSAHNKFHVNDKLDLAAPFNFPGFMNPAVTEKDGCDSDCAWRYFCAGGCPLDTYLTTGQFNKRSPYCDVYRALAPQVLRLEALRILKYQHQFTYDNASYLN